MFNLEAKFNMQNLLYKLGLPAVQACITISFYGTGLDIAGSSHNRIIASIDNGPLVSGSTKIVSGLPLGIHSVRFY